MTAGSQTPEPSTLPRGIGLLTTALMSLLVCQALTLGTLVGWIVWSLAGGTGFVGSVDAGFDGAIFGLEACILVWIFPLLFLDGRLTLAVRAYRLLAWGAIGAQVPVLALAFAWRGGSFEAWSVPPFAYAGVLATPMMFILARGLRGPRRLRWLDLDAPPADWEPLRGFSTSPSVGTTTQRGSPFDLLCPPLVCWRSKRWGWFTVTSLVMVGVVAMIILSPLSALPLLALNGVIGRRLVSAGPVPRGAVPLDEPAREAALARVKLLFSRARLAPPPPGLALGLLLFGPLVTFDVTAGLFIHVSAQLHGTTLLDISPALPLIGVIFSFFVVTPVLVLAALAVRPGIWAYWGVGGAAVLGLAWCLYVLFVPGLLPPPLLPVRAAMRLCAVLAAGAAGLLLRSLPAVSRQVPILKL